MKYQQYLVRQVTRLRAYVPTLGTSQELDRISGMDPAGPLFCNDVPYPFDKLNVRAAARLGPHDAKMVQAIHTDGQARWVFSILPQVSEEK